MAAPLVRYRALVADSARWEGFEFRPDDVVISTPPKCGTTWTQMLCGLLIFGCARFPAPLSDVSPWLDMCNRPLDEIRALLEAQRHRRFIKTHTPLDGLPVRGDVTYVVVGRDPRDVSVSYDYHRENMDLERFMELRARAVGLEDLAELPPRPPPLDDPGERFRAFVAADPGSGMPCLVSVLHHLDTAWQRRRQPNLVLLHYADLTSDGPGELRRLADGLGIPCSEARARELFAEASLDRMRERADELAPSAEQRQWKDPKRFFRAGGGGEWRAHASDADLAAYERRVAALVGSELSAWAHHGRLASGIDPAVA